MPYVDAYGAKLYFEESGHGYPIIFIHEFASDIRGWEAQVRYFSRSYRCIAYNARGYPPSDVPDDASFSRVTSSPPFCSAHGCSFHQSM